MERIFITTTIALILVSSAVLALEDCSKQNYILTKLTYENGGISYSGHSLEVGCPSGTKKTGEYKLELFDKNTLVYSTYFSNPGFMFTDVGYNGKINGGIVKLASREFYLTMPALEVGTIKIYRNENLLLNTNIETGQSITRKGGISLLEWVEFQLKEVIALFR